MPRDLLFHHHRSWPLPAGRWIWYQEWNDALFLHAKVDVAIIGLQLPPGLQLDTFDGDAWISVVIFKMQKIRPRMLPHFPPISDFLEVNVRTYVRVDDKPGVFFLRIEADKLLSCFIASRISGLPYVHAALKRGLSRMEAPGLSFNYCIGEDIPSPAPIDKWLAERYALYNTNKGKLYRYQIHHKPWPLKKLAVTDLAFSSEMLKTGCTWQPDLFRYSPGVQVLAWPAERLAVV